MTDLLKAKNVDAIGMVKYGEGFFTSLGFAPLPKTFWERSLFVKPQDRDVVCHASAWDIDNFDDLRLKMCIQVRGEDFVTVHHELGHNFYQRAYENQPFLFKNGANDGFHEAIGDSIALAITPEYLNKVGLLATIPQTDDTGYLLRMALDKVAFLPFGLLIDQWRWKVFSGEIKPADYNKAWWQMREKYQGISPPVARSEADFDPGAKYHVAGKRPVHALLPGADSAVPVLSRHVPRGRIHRPALSLLVLRQQGGGREAECHARDGPEQALARRAVRPHRRAPDGRRRHDGVLRSAEAMARRTEQGQAGGLDGEVGLSVTWRCRPNHGASRRLGSAASPVKIKGWLILLWQSWEFH